MDVPANIPKHLMAVIVEDIPAKNADEVVKLVTSIERAEWRNVFSVNCIMFASGFAALDCLHMS